MKINKLFAGCLYLIFSGLPIASYALSPEAESGKTKFTICYSCHNPSLDPAMAPPMWGIQKRYKKNTSTKEEFIQKITNFAKSPSKDNALFINAIDVMGLMPAMPLPDATLHEIGAYIWENKFPPPCDHWAIAIKRAQEAGDSDHVQQDIKMQKKFCRK